MLQEAIPHYADLTASDKLLLLDELWADIAEHHADLPVPQWQQQELTQRYSEYLVNPREGSSWTEVKERLLSLLGANR